MRWRRVSASARDGIAAMWGRARIGHPPAVRVLARVRYSTRWFAARTAALCLIGRVAGRSPAVLSTVSPTRSLFACRPVAFSRPRPHRPVRAAG